MTRWLRILRARIRGLLHRDAIAAEIREELRFHMDMRAEEYERRGLDPAAARRLARERVGHLALHQDRGYDIRGGGVMETIVQDIRYSVRLLIEQRGFATVAIVTLALAIGAVTAVVSVIDAAILRPLPFPDPEQLVEVNVSMPLEPGERPRNLMPSMEDLRNWQETGGVFSELAVWDTAGFGRILDDKQPERIQITEITEDYLALHGLAPLHGRDFNAADMVPGAAPVAMLGHGYWQSRYGGDPDAVGETMRIGDTTYSIVGVLPPGLDDSRVLWPLRVDPERQTRRGMGGEVYGRMLPGMTVEQAEARLSASLHEDPGPDGVTARASANISSLLEQTTDRYRRTVVVLTGAVAFVLLLACVNVAGLQLARGSTRQVELAVRASLGAGRGRLMRQLMIENFVLAGAGALLGLFLAWASLDVLVANLPLSLPLNAPVTLNFTVLAVCAAVTLVTAFLFGLLPALRLSRVRVGTALAKAGGRHATTLSRRGSQLLMAAEIALAVVLVVGAALMLRSFGRVLSVDLGFDPEAIVTMEVVPVAADAATHQQYYPALVRDLRLIPGVEAVGAVDHLPLAGGTSFSGISVAGQSHFVEIRSVLPGYVEALGIPVIAGRTMTENDYRSGVRVAMLNELAAREMFPDGPAVGRSFSHPVRDDLGNRIEVEWEVIGVIGAVRHNSAMREGGSEVFFPYQASPSDAERGRGLTVVVRPGEPIPNLVGRLRDTAQAVGPRVLVESVRQGSDHLGDRVIIPRRRTVLLGLLGSLGLTLALVGVFGLTAYTVARRTREIGVRLTFGAQPRQVVAGIMRDAAVPIAMGIVAGLFGAFAATRVIASFLFETAPTDPSTFAIVAVLLAFAGCVAAWIPARRAVRIDPVIALRAE